MIVWMTELKKLPALVAERVTRSFYFPMRVVIACRIVVITTRAKVAHDRKLLGFLSLGGSECAFGT